MSQDGPVKEKRQSRLPFKVLDVKKTLPNSSLIKKRKLSDSETINSANKVSKKEDDSAIIGATVDAENVPTLDHVAKRVDSKKLELQNVFQNKNSNFVSVDNKSAHQISNINEELNLADVSGHLTASPNSSDPALESNTTTRPNSKNDSIEFNSDIESEMEFSRTETSELDASLIFNQGSQLGDSTGANLSSSKKKRPSPMNPKKIEEKEKRKQEKLRLRSEREKQLQEARELKKKQKEEEKLQRDQKKLEEKQRKQKELEEKKLKDQKERDEKLKILQEKKEKLELDRLEKLKAKEEEKQKKLKMLNEKQDEKKRKEEERLKKLEEKKKFEEEEEKKKLKEKAVFAKFFIKNETSPSNVLDSETSVGIFKPFEVKKDMTVASVVPSIASNLFKKDDFENSFEEQESSELYLDELRSGKHTPLFKTKADLKKKVQSKCDDDEDEVVIVDDTIKKTSHKAKLLQFHENVRPPYYGTWMKKSNIITSRKPFVEDTAFFDYEVDSDEDWDEGGPGESLSGTDGEKESEDDYEVDNEFFVPHGYLSADEEKDDEIGENPENLQKRLKMRQLEFQEQLKNKCMEMKPRITGCLWLSESCSNEDDLKLKLSLYSAVSLVPMPITLSQILPNTTETEGTDTTLTPIAEPKNSLKVPEEALPYFIQLIHANTNNRNIIIKEFQQFWLRKTREADGKPPNEDTPESGFAKPNISKRQLDLTLGKIASWMRCPDPAMNRLCWWVCDAVREKHNCKNLAIPNQWSYITRKDPELSPIYFKTGNVNSETVKPTAIELSTPCILKFAKVVVNKLPLSPGINLKEKSEVHNEKRVSDVEVKKARRIVPTTIVAKSKEKAPIPSENSSLKEHDTMVLEERTKVNTSNTKNILKTPGCGGVKNINMDNSEEKILQSDKPEEQEKVNKTAADRTPSILKFIKRIAPVSVKVEESKKPKLTGNNDLATICIDLD